MKKLILACPFLIPTVAALAGALLPTEIGTTWEYAMVEEADSDVPLQDQPGRTQTVAPVLIMDRIDGMQNVGKDELLKLVRRRAGLLISTDLIAVNEQGIIIRARAGNDGRTVAVDPPQSILVTPVQIGTQWTYRGKVAGVTLQEQCEITGEEDMNVAAGKFHAYHIHCAPSSALSSAIDRWFVPGVGFIKEVTTTRAPTGDLLQRTSLELQKPPKIVAVPETTASLAPKKLSVSVANAPEGKAATSFSSAVTRICARWNGRGLRPSAKVRAVWIAEDVGDIAPLDYKIDEASTIVTEPNARGIFTLSRPESGWAEGKYRVEFYLDQILVDTVKLEIHP